MNDPRESMEGAPPAGQLTRSLLNVPKRLGIREFGESGGYPWGYPLMDRSEFQNGTRFERNEVWRSIELLCCDSLQERVIKIHGTGERLDPHPLILSIPAHLVPVIRFPSHSAL